MTTGKVLDLVDELLNATAGDADEAARLLRARHRQRRDREMARRDDVIRAVRAELLPEFRDLAAAVEIAAAARGARTGHGANVQRRREIARRLRGLGVPGTRMVRQILATPRKPLALDQRGKRQLLSSDLDA
jgi:hypothetical protein